MQTQIEQELVRLGMNRRSKGFSYCAHAIGQLCREPFLPAKTVYARVAQACGTHSASVERDIRYTVEKTWETGDWRQIDRLFGYTVCRERGKPTNREFLCRLAEKIRMESDRDA